jgi:hypothetical protein
MNHTLRLNQYNWVVLAYNFNVVILMLTIGELSIGAFLLTILFQFYPFYYLILSFYSYTCWVPTISVLNLVIFPCYSNLLLRRKRWTGILRRGVLCYVLPRLPFLWSYRVFRCSVLLRVVIVFWKIGEDDQRRRGEWEPIKIPRRNLAYILKSIWRSSLLTQPRPSSYGWAIDPRNRVRNCNGHTKQC